MGHNSKSWVIFVHFQQALVGQNKVAKTQIELDIPERTKPDKNSFNVRAKKLEPWIADLPRANLGETARQVYRVLKETNHLQFSHLERIYFLEKIREPVFYITSAMKKYYVGVNFPLAEKNYKVASACREIFMALATGYNIAIADLLANSLLFTDKKLLSKIIHRSLNSLSHVLLTTYQAYEPCPNDIWADINKLYYFAETKKLVSTEVSDAHRKHHLQSTIQAEYLRMLLIHLASPYRLRQGEVGKVFNTMERWTTECTLSVHSNQSPHGYFTINLQGNSPPCSLALTTEQCNSEKCRIINTRNLAVMVEDELKNSADMVTTTLPGVEMQRNELSHDLLRRLLIAWGIVPKRLFPRTQKNEKLHITLGLSATHKVICDGNYNARKDPANYPGQTKDKFIHTAQFNSSSISNVNDKQPDIWDMIYPTAHKEDQDTRIKEPTIENNQPAQQVETSYYQVESWTMMNESANGYCIATKAIGDTNIQVGELIGIQRNNDGHTWKWAIGVVRWMKYEKEQGLILGVEMLTPDAAAIGIKSAFSDENEDYKRSLMLPELQAIKQAKTLITGPVPFRVGNQLTMHILGKPISISLTRQLQNTGFFAQFEFDMVEQKEEHNPEKDQHADEPDDFNSIWSII